MGRMKAGAVALSASTILLISAATNGAKLSSVDFAHETPRPRITKGDDISDRAISILQANCIKCHDSVKKTAGIDLTTRSQAISAKVINEGALSTSRLLREVVEGRMPPSGKLGEQSIEVLQKWVLSGASYPATKLVATNPAMQPLWSFQPVQLQRVPQTPFDKLAHNPIDHFVFDRLAANRLAPAPRADKLTLLRRVTIDLTGLPPTQSEIAAFSKDTSTHAYEKVVDRLLASPAYGERWGRHWLDVVRYGESDGYERNIIRPNAWPYRDYVIRAFNKDIPYTQFISEQLAGDTVGKGDPNVEAATGFLVAGIHDTVGNATEEGTRQQRISDLEDITSTTSAAFLGLTIGCARCHDHKFDPIPQRDFYRLASVFAGVRFGERTIISGPALSKAQAAKAEIASFAFQAINALNELDDAARPRVPHTSGRPSGLRPAVNARRNVDTFTPILARYVRFTVLATRDGAEPCLDEIQVSGPGSHDDLALAFHGAVATASGVLPGYEFHQIRHLNDGRLGNEYSWISDKRGTGWVQICLPSSKLIDRVVWSRDGGEVPRFDDRVPTRYRIEVSLDGTSWKTVSAEGGRETGAARDYVHPDELLKAMTQAERVRRSRLQKDIQDLRRRSESLTALNTAYAGQFTSPDPTYLLRRGDVMQRAELVTPGALSQVASLEPDLCQAPNDTDPARRIALSHWIGSERNPLAGRVIVNRIWQYHFGRGIVGTPSDFGRNGEKPSHPELLDWLANDFMANGWRMKRLHRMIVTSATYCQSGESTGNGAKVDAGNRFLWHMPLRRMEAEALRDAILATSGKLDRRMGGPGFQLFKYSELNVATYDPLDKYGPETWRRSVYRASARAIRDELLETFDCPESAQREPRRATTTTALQALSLLNGKFLLQQADFFADRVRREAGSQPKAQVDRAFQLAFGRKPLEAERKAAQRLVAKQGLPTLCRGLMNANEFLYF